MPRLALAAAVCALSLVAARVAAHHSTAIYDSDNPIELAGTVVEWQFVNPHVFIVLEVAGDATSDKRVEPRRRQHRRLVPTRLDAEHSEARRQDRRDGAAATERRGRRQLQQPALGRRNADRAATRRRGLNGPCAIYVRLWALASQPLG
jgi:hypothetical protein